MRSYGAVILDVVVQARREALVLSGCDHTVQDLLRLITDVGGEVERFLRKVVYSGQDHNWTLVKLIDNLSSLGVGQSTIDKLHTLRRAYNAAKHEAHYSPATADVLELLGQTEVAIQALADSGIGLTQSQAVPAYRRVFWFAAWDHYIGGDTEVHLILPATEDVWLPPSFDTIYIDMSAWNVAKTRLESIGLRIGRGTVPDKFYDEFAAEGDFLEAGIFEGDYRELLAVLAEYERVEDILPFLKRESDHSAITNALLLATVDVVVAGQVVEDITDLAETIGNMAAHRYAAPRHSPAAVELAPKLARLILSVDPAIRKSLTGPYWTSAKTFDALVDEAVAQSEQGDVVVTRDGRLAVSL